MSIGPSPNDPRSVLALEPIRRLSVEDYHRVIEAGVFDEDERIELLEGVIVQVSPQKPRHAEVISRLTRFVGSTPSVILRVQLPLSLGPDSEPEPDVAVAPPTPGGYRDHHPTTALLVFEVSGESLRKDRVAKAALYARAGIPEYVIVNLAEDCMEVRQEPDPATSEYQSIVILGERDRFESTAVPGVAFWVRDLLD